MPATPTAVASAPMATHAPTRSTTGPVSVSVSVATVPGMTTVSPTIAATIVIATPAYGADVRTPIPSCIPVWVGDTVASNIRLGISVTGADSASREAQNRN